MWLTILAYKLAQATPGEGSWSPWVALTQIGVGALIAIPFIVSWRDERKRTEALTAEVARLNAERVDRERELSDRMSPMLADAAHTLRDTQVGLAAVHDRPAREVDVTLRRLEHLVDELDRRRGQ